MLTKYACEAVVKYVSNLMHNANALSIMYWAARQMSRASRIFQVAWLAFAASFAVALSVPARAQSSAAVPTETILKEVEVRDSAEQERPREPLRPSHRLQGEALRERGGETLGEAIGDEMGVANSSFGPGVGLPVIRGLSGARVRVLSNGGASHDASTFSPDHATSAEAMLADEVRILRGPATVRYGGGAIGGAIDVIDNRIPRRLPVRPLTGVVQGRHNANGDVNAGSFKLDARAGSNLALHASGFSRRRNFSQIKGCAVDTEATRAQFGLINTRNTCGHVDNTNARADALTLGGAAYGEIGMIGVAASRLANNYGVPPAAGHLHGDGGVRIDLANERYDLRSEIWGKGGVIENVRLEMGRTRYRHHEIEGTRIATTFQNEVLDTRLEVEHRFNKRLAGTLGMQSVDRTFSALGVESFIPRTVTAGSALYLTEQLDLDGGLRLEAGWRRERQSTSADPQRTVDNRLLRFPLRTFRIESHSVAVSWAFAPRSSVALIHARSTRAPDVHELYSFGPHLATNTFDVGVSNLRVESMRSKDLTLDTDFKWGRVNATLFESSADNFIFQRSAGNLFFDTDENRFRARCVSLDQCLPVTRYDQADARFRGYEIELTLRLKSELLGASELTLFSDRVRGRLPLRNEDVPRLPTPRYGVQWAKNAGPWSWRVRYTLVEPQAFPGANETATRGHALLNAYASYRQRIHGQEAILFLRGRNLLNQEVRNATSFLRNFSPEPGLSLEAGVEVRF